MINGQETIHVRTKGQALTELGLRSKGLPLLITMDQSSWNSTYIRSQWAKKQSFIERNSTRVHINIISDYVRHVPCDSLDLSHKSVESFSWHGLSPSLSLSLSLSLYVCVVKFNLGQ